MSYYFTILSPTDVPLFNIAFGTSKSGGDGIARFRFPDTAQYMNQFIIHSSLDMVEEAQWMNGNMYLKHIDTYPPASAYISAFLTPSGARFLLLHQPPQLPSTAASASGTSGSILGGSFSASALGGGSSRASASSVAANPTSPQTEEAVRQFMGEVYENYVKTVMSPFYRQGMEIRSSVFRSRVTAAGRKWL
ncbi:TRAPP subunit TRS20 [Aspergillus homomorphus CBS 101889]|uniref:Putative trafficking protein particle complex subunit 2/Sedlin n=1 Tax=Aspergillus homomorphus (strain CBS 101889) TaxID=1450537 RepID=A0A395I4J5_ASPHC|nr:putative trafficking protein particle complex subunit 2/Sedlin [Aspergillus homomorphus CBS 101889]RAL15132.1 putative trafficking protein particle complex subunit 2/Sedlin [Aspergillus homomorphus CBS 101889]